MHVHKLVLLKEPSEGYKIYWCHECGVVCEFLTAGMAEMIPSWTKARLFNENPKNENENYEFKYEFISKNSDDFMYKGNKRLGKGLKDIKSPAPVFLEKLLKKSDK